MDAGKYIWMNGKLAPWKKAQVHVLTHSLHYGAAVFEGIRVYKTSKGPSIFRLQDHTKRLFYSAAALRMEIPYTQEKWNLATIETVRRNKLEQGYIRPIIYLGYGKMGLSPKGAPVEAAIACWPWGKYLSEDPIDVKIVRTMRIHPRSSVTDAKITGHYVNSIIAVLELSGTKYQEALLLDYKGNIAEGPGENFFIVKKGMLITPPLGTILKGITRDSIMIIARDLGFQVKEKTLKPSQVFDADEAFFTGTASEMTPIKSIDDQRIGSGRIGPITQRLQTAFMDIATGKNARYKSWLSVIQ